MDEGVSVATIEVLLQNLMYVLKEEFSLIQGLDEDAQQLQTTLSMSQSYLNDAEKKSIHMAAVEIWLRKLEALAFEADIVLHELTYHLLRKKVKKMKAPKNNKVLSCFSSFNHTASLWILARKMKKINKDFMSINKSSVHLGLKNRILNVAVDVHASYDTVPLTLDPIFIGRDDVVSEIVEKLTESSRVKEMKLCILAINGMGGMGKTTLTRKVFNHPHIKTQFGSLVWVHVSQTFDPFDPITLFKKILSTLTSYTSDGVESKEVILEKLQKALRNKTYLLVIDDIGYVNVLKLEVIIDFMSAVNSTKGNAIIITTKKDKVTSTKRNWLLIHPLKGLSDEDCWSIIKAKAFDNGQVPSSRFEMIGRKIAQRCQGLPLAANVVGGALFRCRSEEEWHFINEYWFSNGEGGENILKILRLSYDNLPSPSHKKCLTYCSIFPKGQKLVKQELVEMWMAERFLQVDQRNDDMECVGNQVFDALLHYSLLQDVERDDYGNVEKCVMSNLVYDMARLALGSSNNAYGINPLQCMTENDASNVAKQLHTLILKGDHISDTVFSNFKCSHVLTLDGYGFKQLPIWIEKMIHLSYLNISNTRIETLPDWIYKLYHLQTLNASTETLRELPSTFKLLISLRHLYIPSDVKLSCIGTFTNLRSLKFRVGELKGYRIEELGMLKNLKQLTISDLEKVRNQQEALEAKLLEKKNLIELELEWNAADREGGTNDESVLKSLQPCSNLERLRIKGFRGRAFPQWIIDMTDDGSWRGRGLDKLTAITLSKCLECEEIPTLGHLPNLKYLHLWSLCKVKSIKSSFYSIDRCSGSIFPALTSLLLSDMPELVNWEEGELSQAEVFPRLQSLKIYHCKNLGSLPSWLFAKADNLSELDIRHCSNLTELPEGIHSLTSLKSLTINGCPSLKSILNPSGAGKLTSLVSLEIHNCQELVKTVELCAPLLRKVSISELKSLENLPSFIDCLAESPLLEELTIVGIPKFKSSSSLEIWPFRRLQKLEIDLGREWSSKTIGKTGSGIMQSCYFLRELILRGLESWKWMPPSILQHLTALESLKLENFGGEELPEWFGGLSSLTRLCLANFTELRHLPSKDAMERLTNLEALYIRDCPRLRIESERHKIHRVGNVYVNGHQI